MSDNDWIDQGLLSGSQAGELLRFGRGDSVFWMRIRMRMDR